MIDLTKSFPFRPICVFKTERSAQEFSNFNQNFHFYNISYINGTFIKVLFLIKLKENVDKRIYMIRNSHRISELLDIKILNTLNFIKRYAWKCPLDFFDKKVRVADDLNKAVRLVMKVSKL